MPAASQRSPARSACAMPATTTKKSSVQATCVPWPWYCEARYASPTLAPSRTVSPPVYTRNDELVQIGFGSALTLGRIMSRAPDGLQAGGSHRNECVTHYPQAERPP